MGLEQDGQLSFLDVLVHKKELALWEDEYI